MAHAQSRFRNIQGFCLGESNRRLSAQLRAHECQTIYITGLLIIPIDSFVNLLGVTLG